MFNSIRFLSHFGRVFHRNWPLSEPVLFRSISCQSRSTPNKRPFLCNIQLGTYTLSLKSCNMTTPTVVDYGSWKSPISSELATAASVLFQEVHVDTAGGKGDTVYWSELRFEEKGRYVVCSQQAGQVTDTYDAWTPVPMNARTRVHEYGGGAFFVNNSTVYFSNFDDQRLYRQNAASAKPSPITPEGSGWRFADGEFHKQLSKIYIIREDHSLVEKKEAKEAVNSVVCIDPNTQEQTVLASGCDFYSSPRVSPDGRQIAWVQWNHPNMPWDSTEVWTAELELNGSSVKDGSAKKVAGGDGISVIHPTWTPDNRLLYIGDQTDWWNLYLLTPDGEHVNLLPRNEELGSPHWVFSFTKYAVDPSGSGDIVTSCGKELGIVNMNTHEYRILETGFSFHCFLNYSSDGHVYCQGESPSRFPCLIRVNPKSGKVDIVRESKKLTIDEGYISIPKGITWTTSGGKTCHGYLYLPQNKDYQPPEGALPPLLVQAHGGPTSCAFSKLNLKKQYFTSRGFAVLDVDYRGSTGYGRPYREELRNSWGLCDVEDCSNGARHLVETGVVDRERVCIDGGSAGGYTTLACLAFTDVFKAGASHYGVADIELLAAETHKFESRYMDIIVAPYSDQTKAIYQERSPINHINKFSCPVIFFQGDEDKIVPPNQAELMYEKLKEKGLPCCLIMFAGEQHGFRKSENVQKALDGEFYFFSRVFKFEAADKHCRFDITNLDG